MPTRFTLTVWDIPTPDRVVIKRMTAFTPPPPLLFVFAFLFVSHIITDCHKEHEAKSGGKQPGEDGEDHVA